MSKLGSVLAGIYLLACLCFIGTQGLTGESFIAIILGFPLSFGFAFFEYWGAEGAFLVVLLLLPIALNAYILYWIGSRIHGAKSNRTLAKSSDVGFVPAVMGDGAHSSHASHADGASTTATSTDSGGGASSGGGDGGAGS